MQALIIAGLIRAVLWGVLAGYALTLKRWYFVGVGALGVLVAVMEVVNLASRYSVPILDNVAGFARAPLIALVVSGILYRIEVNKHRSH